jgi:hypothetical protein
VSDHPCSADLWGCVPGISVPWRHPTPSVGEVGLISRSRSARARVIKGDVDAAPRHPAYGGRPEANDPYSRRGDVPQVRVGFPIPRQKIARHRANCTAGGPAFAGARGSGAVTKTEPQGKAGWGARQRPLGGPTLTSRVRSWLRAIFPMARLTILGSTRHFERFDD